MMMFEAEYPPQAVRTPMVGQSCPIFIDIETLGLLPGAAITEIAIVRESGHAELLLPQLSASQKTNAETLTFHGADKVHNMIAAGPKNSDEYCEAALRHVIREGQPIFAWNCGFDHNHLKHRFPDCAELQGSYPLWFDFKSWCFGQLRRVVKSSEIARYGKHPQHTALGDTKNMLEFYRGIIDGRIL